MDTKKNWSPEAKLLYEELQKARYDPNAPPPPDTTLLTIGGRSIGSLGNFIALIGRPKVGKGVYLVATLASAFLPGDIWGIKIQLPPDRPFVQYYDTEQGLFHYHRQMTTVKNYIGMDNLPRTLSGFLLREVPAEDTMSMIEVGIWTNPKVSVVFIDGLLDLCVNYNDERESRKVIEWLLRITKQYNVLVIGVIHQSKKEQYSIGHLGSAVDRYAESTLLIEKDTSKKFITLSAQLLRNTIDEFPPITIHHNGERFEQSDTPMKAKQLQGPKQPAELEVSEHKYMISEVIRDGGIGYDDVVQALCEVKAFSKVLSKKFISYWVSKAFIFRDDSKMYHRSKEAKLFIAPSK